MSNTYKYVHRMLMENMRVIHYRLYVSHEKFSKYIRIFKIFFDILNVLLLIMIDIEK